MEFLKAKFEKVAYFRPFVQDENRDSNISLFLERYSLNMEYSKTFGFTVPQVERFIAQNRFDLVLKELIEKMKGLEKEYNFVLVEGA